MVELKNVTLVTVDGVDPERSVKTLNYCCRGINFNTVKLISFREPENLTKNIKFVKINQLSNAGYNRFIAKDLATLIDTDFCMIVQLDGFVLNPNLWTDNFLKYDYIGAPWSAINIDNILTREYRKNPVGHPWVGNGGFSIRSLRLLKEASKFEWLGKPEDNFFCVGLRDHMEKIGFIYAPVDLGYKFSLETPMANETPILPADFSDHFGFHGFRNLWKYLDI